MAYQVAYQGGLRSACTRRYCETHHVQRADSPKRPGLQVSGIPSGAPRGVEVSMHPQVLRDAPRAARRLRDQDSPKRPELQVSGAPRLLHGHVDMNSGCGRLRSACTWMHSETHHIERAHFSKTPGQFSHQAGRADCLKRRRLRWFYCRQIVTRSGCRDGMDFTEDPAPKSRILHPLCGHGFGGGRLRSACTRRY